MTSRDFFNTELGGMAKARHAPDGDLHRKMAGIKAQVDAIRAGGQKPYLVGENGPEVIVPKNDGVVVPNPKKPTRKALMLAQMAKKEGVKGRGGFDPVTGEPLPDLQSVEGQNQTLTSTELAQAAKSVGDVVPRGAPTPEEIEAQRIKDVMNPGAMKQYGLDKVVAPIVSAAKTAGSAIIEEGKSFAQRPIVSVPGAGVASPSLAQVAGVEFAGSDKKNFDTPAASPLSVASVLPQPGAKKINAIVDPNKTELGKASIVSPNAQKPAAIVNNATTDSNEKKAIIIETPNRVGKFNNTNLGAAAQEDMGEMAVPGESWLDRAERGRMENRADYMPDAVNRQRDAQHLAYTSDPNAKYSEAGGLITPGPTIWKEDMKSRGMQVEGRKMALESAAHSDRMAQESKKTDAMAGNNDFDQQYKLADLAVRKDNYDTRNDMWDRGQQNKMTLSQQKEYSDAISKHEEERNKATMKLLESAQVGGAQPDPDITRFQAERYIGGGLMYGPDNKTPGYGKRDSSGRILSFVPFGQGQAGLDHYNKIMSTIEQEKKAQAEKAKG